jgi:signal transduction histidine kinase
MINIDALRRVPLFSNLTDEQFRFVEQGTELWLSLGDQLVAEGDPADNFYVLLEGEVEFTKKIRDQEVHIFSYEAGTFFGHEPILLDIPIPVTGRAIRDCHLFKLEEPAFWQMLATCPLITRELLRTIAQRLQQTEAVTQQHGKLIALGTLSAGFAHELNNPAAAVSRGARHLEEIFQSLLSLTFKLNRQQMTNAQLTLLFDLQQHITEQAKTFPDLDPLTQSDREDEVIDWLGVHGVADEWKLAPTLVGAGLGTDWLDTVVDCVPTDLLGDVLTWLTTALIGVGLLSEINQGSTRISELIEAIKNYSYMDQTPLQEVDVHEGLESTLTILTHKLKQGVVVTRKYDRSLPRIYAYASELNQVWTNLIDNAIDAMDGQGQIWIRTSQLGNRIVVEIADDGPGMAPEMQSRIFEQFFTTKDVGKGTGLGLDIVRRIVVGRQKGEIRVFSKPGDTRFQVRLPIINISKQSIQSIKRKIL